MLVNLSTPDKNLEDLILTEYPGKIFKSQVSKKYVDKRKNYCFSKLEYEELMKFLINHPNYEFRITEHSTGRFIEGDRKFNNPSSYH